MFVPAAGSSPLSKLKVYCVLDCVACFNGPFKAGLSLIYNAERDSATEMGNFTENGPKEK